MRVCDFHPLPPPVFLFIAAPPRPQRNAHAVSLSITNSVLVGRVNNAAADNIRSELSADTTSRRSSLCNGCGADRAAMFVGPNPPINHSPRWFGGVEGKNAITRTRVGHVLFTLARRYCALLLSATRPYRYRGHTLNLCGYINTASLCVDHVNPIGPRSRAWCAVEVGIFGR